MLKLELKIPPLLLTLILGVLMWLLSLCLPTIAVPNLFRISISILILGAGLFVLVLGVTSFKFAGTTVNPMSPDSTSSLVTSGVYRFTRNPMYLGFLLFLIALGVFLASLYSFLLPALFIPYMNKFQIEPEEKSMQEMFGSEYSNYAMRVRRWV